MCVPKFLIILIAKFINTHNCCPYVVDFGLPGSIKQIAIKKKAIDNNDEYMQNNFRTQGLFGYKKKVYRTPEVWRAAKNLKKKKSNWKK